MTARERRWRRAKTDLSSWLVRIRDRVVLADGALAGARWPVREPSERRAPFFVLGSPRSGTTLLRAILSAHPDVFVPPENGGLGPMIRRFAVKRASGWSEVTDAVLDEFRRGYEFDFWKLDVDTMKQMAHAMPEQERTLAGLLRLVYEEYGRQNVPGKHIWGDKTTPGSYHYIYKVARVFPDARYVHMVRDGRDCVSSCVRAGFFDKSVERAAEAWSDNVRLCRRFGQRIPDRFHELRYEDLVRSPADEIRRLAAFLQIDAADEMFHHDRLVRASTPDVNELSHHENVRKPVTTSSLGKWRSELSSSDVEVVSPIVAPELAEYGYARD